MCILILGCKGLNNEYYDLKMIFKRRNDLAGISEQLQKFKNEEKHSHPFYRFQHHKIAF